MVWSGMVWVLHMLWDEHDYCTCNNRQYIVHIHVLAESVTSMPVQPAGGVVRQPRGAILEVVEEHLPVQPIGPSCIRREKRENAHQPFLKLL